jgi:DtxR family transcriptional regulator, Mn-dependent transcriptional regulator
VNIYIYISMSTMTSKPIIYIPTNLITNKASSSIAGLLEKAESTTKRSRRYNDAKRKNNIHMKTTTEEQLYVGTAESEHIEMYLKAIWYIHEQGEEVKVSSIAKVLNIRQPSVVEMLQKLNDSSLVRYQKGSLVQLTIEGNRIGKQMIRNTRLLEVLMKDALRMEIDEEMVCGIEHHMKNIFTDALCTLLNHPTKCPHDYDIPRGQCCIKNNKGSNIK